MGFFSAAGEGSGPATFEGDSADAGDQPIMLHQVSIAISNWIHAPKTLEVLGLAAPTQTGFAEIVGECEVPKVLELGCNSVEHGAA